MTSKSNLTVKGPETKRVFHLFGAWNDRKEEAWLRGMAREGWHLEKIGVFSYLFRKGEPADIVYRLDFQIGKFNQKEYLGLYRDAGWEHVGRSGAFYYFRTPAGGGDPEIFTDTASRIQKYQRMLLLFLIVFVVLFNSATNVLTRHQAGAFWIVVRSIQIGFTVLLVYGIVRLLRVIGRLKKAG
jgi:Protein of unknown function (DUF2812)